MKRLATLLMVFALAGYAGVANSFAAPQEDCGCRNIQIPQPNPPDRDMGTQLYLNPGDHPNVYPPYQRR